MMEVKFLTCADRLMGLLSVSCLDIKWQIFTFTHRFFYFKIMGIQVHA